MSRILYLDCFSGVSGDMLLGALLDAGLPIDELRAALGSLALEGVRVETRRVSKAGVAATKFSVVEVGKGRDDVAGDDRHEHGSQHHHDHSHGHDHDEASSPSPRGRGAREHGHHSLAEITERIERSNLSLAGKRRATELFRRLAEAEAEIHQMPIERVHLHEVGAIDSIVDIVGAVFALDWFGADEVVASPLNVGGGTVECAHGTFPVPAPATARLLQEGSVPVYSSGARVELVTPTGALLVSGVARRFGPIPAMTIERIGYGAGDRDLSGAPNVLRVLVGAAATDATLERVVSMTFEIDDMNPQLFGPLMERLHADGALDVFYVPAQMKKNRPGTLVTIVAPPERREALLASVFRETTTIGVRFQEMDRERLDRESIGVRTAAGEITVKVARRRGAIVNAAPEFEDCARAAERSGLSIKEVQALAMRAYLDQRTEPSSTD